MSLGFCSLLKVDGVLNGHSCLWPSSTRYKFTMPGRFENLCASYVMALFKMRLIFVVALWAALFQWGPQPSKNAHAAICSAAADFDN